MKTILVSLILLLFATVNIVAQNTITVDATGEVAVPADLVQLQINIRVTDETPAGVFEEHKRQEEFLAGLIREHGLDDENLRFQPMNIGARQTRDGREYQSHQTVNLKLEDFTLFEEIQVLLIENGFENFSGRFNSTEMDSGENEALDLAIASAKDKAERIAANIGKSLGEVKSIEHTVQRVFRDGLQFAEMARTDSGSMMEFAQTQTIPVSSSIRIVYTIE